MNVSIGPHTEKIFTAMEFTLGIAVTFNFSVMDTQYRHCYEEKKNCTYDTYEDETDCACVCDPCKNMRELFAEWKNVRAQLRKIRAGGLSD